MTTISACMIVKNEEQTLDRCLRTFAPVMDEIIIVDTGSTDRTKEIALKYPNVKLFDFQWINDFAAARNFSFQQATCDYLFWMDADDIIKPFTQEWIRQIKQDGTLEQWDAIRLQYNYYKECSPDDDTHIISSYPRTRFIRRSINPVWHGPIHEAINPPENIWNVPAHIAAIEHKYLQKDRSSRNLGIFRQMEKDQHPLLNNYRMAYMFAQELRAAGHHEESIKWFEKTLSSDPWDYYITPACMNLFEIYYDILNQPDTALNWLFYSCKFMEPRADVCCAFGRYFFERNMDKQAIWWYEKAIDNIMPARNDFYTWEGQYTTSPMLQLCVLYDRAGDHRRAFEYNEQISAYEPDNAAYLQNKEYFRTLGLY